MVKNLTIIVCNPTDVTPLDIQDFPTETNQRIDVSAFYANIPTYALHTLGEYDFNGYTKTLYPKHSSEQILQKIAIELSDWLLNELPNLLIFIETEQAEGLTEALDRYNGKPKINYLLFTADEKPDIPFVTRKVLIGKIRKQPDYYIHISTKDFVPADA